jgi:peptidoglycan/LPS O-acetylase OafA/YrhL
MLGITIDLARGLAALAVFLFHIADHLSACCVNLALLAKNGGSSGVAVFFVISGYCITSSADKASHHGSGQLSFLKKRFLRIYPPFWAALIVTLAAPYLLEIISYMRTGNLAWPERDWNVYGINDWLQIASLTRVFYGTGQESLHILFRGVNPVYWTLAIEFQFYLVMFLSLLTKQYWKATLVLVTVLGLIAMYFPTLLPERRSGLFLGYWPLFALGMALYFLLKNGVSLTRLPKHIGLAVAMSIVLALSLWVMQRTLQDRLGASLSELFGDTWFGFAGLSALALWAAAPLEAYLKKAAGSGNNIISLPLKLGVYLGAISYSLYLLHGRMFQVVEKTLKYLHISNESWLGILIIIIGTIIISAVFYHFFEKPFIHHSKYKA